MSFVSDSSVKSTGRTQRPFTTEPEYSHCELDGQFSEMFIEFHRKVFSIIVPGSEAPGVGAI